MGTRLAVRVLALLAAIAFGDAAPAAQGGARSEEASVRAVFEAYKSAILGKRGAEAATLLTRESVAYYDEMKALALRAPEASVRALSPTDKIVVLRMRHEIPVAELARMRGEALVAYAVDRGWIGASSVANSELGAVRVDGAVAAGEYVAGGQRTPISYRFAREGGAWKLDLQAIVRVGDAAFRQLIRSEGADEDEYVLGLLEAVSGRKPPPSVWQPLE